MPVVISEFEVVAEPAAAPVPEPPRAPSAAPAPAAGQALNPHELHRLLCRLEERAARLRAD